MPATEDLAYLSAAQQGRLLRERQLSPVELARACLERIERAIGVEMDEVDPCPQVYPHEPVFGRE